MIVTVAEAPGASIPRMADATLPLSEAVPRLLVTWTLTRLRGMVSKNRTSEADDAPLLTIVAVSVN